MLHLIIWKTLKIHFITRECSENFSLFHFWKILNHQTYTKSYPDPNDLFFYISQFHGKIIVRCRFYALSYGKLWKFITWECFFIISLLKNFTTSELSVMSNLIWILTANFLIIFDLFNLFLAFSFEFYYFSLENYLNSEFTI